MFYSKINKSKSGIKISTEVDLNLLSNVVGDSNDETNFPHKILLTNIQISRTSTTYANCSSAYLTFLITKLF